MKRRFCAMLVALCAMLALLFASCTATNANNAKTTEPNGTTVKQSTEGTPQTDEVPKDFHFRICWNINGESSYDSGTGVLVKTTETEFRSPDEYVTTLVLTEEQRKTIYDLLCGLDVDSYPDVYDPFATEEYTMHSTPSTTLILTVGSKTIECRDIAIGWYSENPKGQKFLSATHEIVSLITSTDEWQALPEFEVLYY